MYVLLSGCSSNNIFDYMQPNRKEFPLSQDYLEEKDDGLLMRSSGDYAKDKLKILEAYVRMFIVSMRPQNWRAINYIDLQAGPGKNLFSPSSDVMLGSPLIALTAEHHFDNYWFVELNDKEYQALSKRISVSPRSANAHVLQGDCNIVVDNIVKRIEAIDKPFIKDTHPSLNLAFLDPEGIELEWETVEKLANMKRMDLIINFSTSGFTRNVGQMFNTDEETKIDKFFGTDEWRKEYEKVADKDNSHVRRVMIDFYKKRLSQFGYTYNEQEIIPPEKVIKNTKGAQIYTLIAASKHRLGDKFWKEAIKQSIQKKLL
jgi:three-Cys-motif partner protein